jgi:predicted TIM-barrel fold metal-dependent hydrolase
MDRKIALEEHFATDDTLMDSAGYLGDDVWAELESRLLDIHGRRIELMDRHGIEMMILSLNAPAVQAIPDPVRAAEVARRANDFLAEQMQQQPDRFQAFAALPMQDPDVATLELERCVSELGFKGALVNGFSQIVDAESAIYYDLPQYRDFWGTIASLDVPFYLHPRNPLPSMAQIYDGHPWLLGPVWAFGQETAVHALRLMASGLFDEYPALTVILGHMGEGLPYNMWRIDNCNAWVGQKRPFPAKRTLGEYFRENFYLTTSGNFHTPTLNAAMVEIGVERVLFSTDWPFENIDHAADWFDDASISEPDRQKIGRDNAARLFKL